LLLKLVGEHGTKWSKIASAWQQADSTKSRSGKQIRDRWVTILDPNVSKAAWSKEEDALLLESHHELGNSWTIIAERLPGRAWAQVQTRFRQMARARGKAQGERPKKQRKIWRVPTADTASELLTDTASELWTDSAIELVTDTALELVTDRLKMVQLDTASNRYCPVRCIYRCSFGGCKQQDKGGEKRNDADDGGFCFKHGGGYRCSHAGCTKQDQGGEKRNDADDGGFCFEHGGGYRCSHACCDGRPTGGKHEGRDRCRYHRWVSDGYADIPSFLKHLDTVLWHDESADTTAAMHTAASASVAKDTTCSVAIGGMPSHCAYASELSSFNGAHAHEGLDAESINLAMVAGQLCLTYTPQIIDLHTANCQLHIAGSGPLPDYVSLPKVQSALSPSPYLLKLASPNPYT
jgi:hypothetical protein